MRIIETKAYLFNELSEEAKTKAIEEWRYGMEVYLDDSEYHNEILTEAGFLDCKVEYSVGSGQGDGACFTGEVSRDHFLVGKYECLKDVDFEIIINSMNSRYCHEKSKMIEISVYEANPHEEALIYELEEEIEAIRLDLCLKIYQGLLSDYEYQISDEAIAEVLDINEFEFTEGGKRI